MSREELELVADAVSKLGLEALADMWVVLIRHTPEAGKRTLDEVFAKYFL